MLSATYPGEHHDDGAEHGSRGIAVAITLEESSSCSQSSCTSKHEDLSGPVDDVCSSKVVGLALLPHYHGGVCHTKDGDQGR